MFIWNLMVAISIMAILLCDNWGKNDIGISYNYLKNYGISETKPYVGKKCIIRRGTIVTSPQQKVKDK